ncbi:MAG TPA: DegT/DnrJ/EryC1/StrS family aminotransferase, partial [Planctomycetota bacterium]|nr:DegT/DnrJ/EryC1/StrS family aminotransferase [Planctomycetota bacterium]
MLARRWLTNGGPLVEELEARVAERLGVRHCVATANGTLALQLAARALDLSGEVIVPSFTFIATASALTWQGLRPVFCDVDRETHGLDPAHAGTLVTPR